MKWPSRNALRQHLDNGLRAYAANTRPLPGIPDDASRDALVMQLIASLRRLDFTEALRKRPIDPARADPSGPLFDPERAALWHFAQGELDEAVWLTFLSVHFGKHGKSGWRRLRDVYSGLGEGLWTWQRVSADPEAFRDWLRRRASEIGGAFGNHRKYESLGADNNAGTASVIRSYVDWVGSTRSHQQRFAELVREGGNDPLAIFDAFYRSFNVARFGRLGRFDFLALIGRLGFAPIAPGSAYLANATGPLRGVRLLFGGATNAAVRAETLQTYLDELDQGLHVGMQVLEDALCNWQKSPAAFKHFIG
jgi:hypothetical protein